MILLALIDAIVALVLMGLLPVGRALLEILDGLAWLIVRGISWCACTSGYHQCSWEITKEWSFYDDSLHIHTHGTCLLCHRRVRGQHLIVTKLDIEDHKELSWPDYHG